jgi:hypothetical protein
MNNATFLEYYFEVPVIDRTSMTDRPRSSSQASTSEENNLFAFAGGGHV